MSINLANPMSGDAFKSEIENALDKRGDTMDDGATLTLGKDPENDMEAGTKFYIDNNAIHVTLAVNSNISPNTTIGRIDGFNKDKYSILQLYDNIYSGSSRGIKSLDIGETGHMCVGRKGSFKVSFDGEIIITESGNGMIELLLLPCKRVTL